MGNKIGKFSTGLDVKGPPSREKNPGYGGKKQVLDVMNDMEPRQRPKPTYVGAAGDPKARRPLSR